MRASRQRTPDMDVAPVVFMAYTDITATASRALFGLEAKGRQYQTLQIPVLDGASPACVHAPHTKVTKTSPPMDAVQVISCRYEEKNKPKVTCIMINTHMTNEKCHYVAKAIVDLCSQRYIVKLVLLTSQRLGVECVITQRSRLPDDTIVTDAFLSNLIQLCTIEGQPFSVVLAPAHRCPSGQANSEDSSLQVS
ncbi:hypothetical protein ACOMHN_011732 [Nucella lapillus]